MLPIIEIPESIKKQLLDYRDVFCKDQGFDWISRYITGLIISPNKTLQGIHDLQVWKDEPLSRRSMHHSVFESGWSHKNLMVKHRELVSKDHQGEHGDEVIALDWTLVHHRRGPEISGVKWLYDPALRSNTFCQLVATATASNNALIDGIEVVVQEPSLEKSEKEYLSATAKPEYHSSESAKERLLELLHHRLHCKQYKKRTQIFSEIVQQIEQENHFPKANYVFDSGVLSSELAHTIEENGKHWVSEVKNNRNISWHGKYQRVDKIAKQLREESPMSFRHIKIRQRNKSKKDFYVFSKVVKLKKYKNKRLVIVHEEKNLSDEPRFLLTDALHWESIKIVKTWSYRWSIEIFHEFVKQQTGFESAQVRNEEAVNKHFCLSCVSQSLIQRVSCSHSKSEKFYFAKGKLTFGQKCRAIAREVLKSILFLAKKYFEQYKTLDHILEKLMPI